MMRRYLAAAFAGALMAACMPAHAQRVSPLKAGRFLQICSGAGSAGMCDAYITGMADAAALGQETAKHEGDATARPAFCVPTTQNGPQMRGVVTAWLRAHQDVLGKPVGEGVFAALHDGYPCHKAAK